MCSTSFTSKGVPNRIALARVFRNEASKNEVWTIFCGAYFCRMNWVAWPDGSMIMGYLLKRSNKMAFWMASSSDGRPSPFHTICSEGVERLEMTSKSGQNGTPSVSRHSAHSRMRYLRILWSKIPAYLHKCRIKGDDSRNQNGILVRRCCNLKKQ